MTGAVLAVQLDYGPPGRWWYRAKDVVQVLGPSVTTGWDTGDFDTECDVGHRWSDSPEDVDDPDVESLLITEIGLRRLAIRNGLPSEQQIRLMELIRDADHCVPRP